MAYWQLKLLALSRSVAPLTSTAFHRSIQGEHVGLEGDAVDHADDLVDPLGLQFDAGHVADDRVDGGSARAGEGRGFVGHLGRRVRGGGTVTEMSSANAEQASGFEQVTKTVGDMDRATQQNAALVEQAAAAAESLKQQSSGLMRSIEAFRTR